MTQWQAYADHEKGKSSPDNFWNGLKNDMSKAFKIKNVFVWFCKPDGINNL